MLAGRSTADRELYSCTLVRARHTRYYVIVARSSTHCRREGASSYNDAVSNTYCVLAGIVLHVYTVVLVPVMHGHPHIPRRRRAGTGARTVAARRPRSVVATQGSVLFKGP
eukprot:COSAG02_NODE_1267_length_13538_cov_11.820746_3_plen_111_part_00